MRREEGARAITQEELTARAEEGGRLPTASMIQGETALPSHPRIIKTINIRGGESARANTARERSGEATTGWDRQTEDK